MKIDGIIMERMDKRLKNIYSAIAICLSYGYEGYYVAGNSCNAAAPNDFDIYPDNDSFDFDAIKSRVKSVNGYVVAETRNALTVNFSNNIVQFCNYHKDTLKTLVESFDFAHIQIGIYVSIDWIPGEGPDDRGGYGSSTVLDVEYTDAWEQAHLLETTWYTGSEYPLSSLLRTVKYYQRGAYAKKSEYKKDILNILNDIIKRGYKSYSDYKDQLAAVDLLLLEPDEKKAAFNLFNTCGSRGLVNVYDDDWEPSEYEEAEEEDLLSEFEVKHD